MNESRRPDAFGQIEIQSLPRYQIGLLELGVRSESGACSVNGLFGRHFEVPVFLRFEPAALLAGFLSGADSGEGF